MHNFAHLTQLTQQHFSSRCDPGFLGYTLAMDCVELAMLRQNATRVRNEMLVQKNKKRGFLHRNNRHADRPGGDLEVFLQRKLQKVSTSIEHHIALHRCQD
jgi:hypothetical protein